MKVLPGYTTGICIRDVIGCPVKLSVHSFRADPCTCCGLHSTHQYAEARRGEPRLWCCQKCHEERQTRSEHCAFCDSPLPSPNDAQCYHYRDSVLETRKHTSPLVPVCWNCQGSKLMYRDWMHVVAEPLLYDREYLIANDPERQWLCSSIEYYTGHVAMAERLVGGALFASIDNLLPPLPFAACSAVLEQRDDAGLVAMLRKHDYPVLENRGGELERALAAADQVFSRV